MTMLHQLHIVLCKSWVFLAVGVLATQTLGKLMETLCTSKQTCRECIKTPNCAWCFLPDGFEDSKRCFEYPNDKLTSQCGESYIENPKNDFNITTKRELTKRKSHFRELSSSDHEAVQISPQEVTLKLRVNEPYTMAVDFAQADDYPVDLYFLMDLSSSMRDDKEKLSNLGGELSSSMKNITSNFRIGFGSFVDKVVMPFTNTAPERLKDPCGARCSKPYDFRNHMKLTNNTDSFNHQVENAKISGNLDYPEGGFDAIMQAIVCSDHIGWREKSRKLLVVSTDSDFHFAGDGKLGGIVMPNDGQCHMDADGYYTYSTLQDYPSISQINQKVKENAINVIFAVVKYQQLKYVELTKNVDGSTCGELKDDSSNVVELVKQEYLKIKSSVELKDKAPSVLKVTYSSKCLDKHGQMKQTNKCDGLKVGTQVSFNVQFELQSCPENPDEWKQKFTIHPVGINESLTVNLEMLCSCPCEYKGFVEKAQYCSGSGTQKCGICCCDSGYIGQRCECGSGNMTEGVKLAEACRPDNTTQTDCSGRGTCVCGQCQCDVRPNNKEEITGRFCDCDNFSCDRHNGVVCSGSNQGKCMCGKCMCEQGWQGSACDCQVSEDTCIPPGGGEICSGRGVCQCGVCKCDQDDHVHYSGQYCDDCPTCQREKCEKFNDCVQCQMYQTGPLDKNECATNCSFVLKKVKFVESPENSGENICVDHDESGCRFRYAYSYDKEGTVIIRAQEERECPAEVYVLGIVLSVIGAIVLIGLSLLLLWKLLTTLHDRREFAKFEVERAKAKWNGGGNPIYKEPTCTFKNPTYGGQMG